VSFQQFKQIAVKIGRLGDGSEDADMAALLRITNELIALGTISSLVRDDFELIPSSDSKYIIIKSTDEIFEIQ
jgi:hypothetical protein